MLYSVRHLTRHSYLSPVSHSLNELRITPRSFAGQRLHNLSLRLQPEPATSQQRKDYFGNDVITIAIYESHSQLSVEARSVVEIEPPNVATVSSIGWEEARARIASHLDDESLQAFEYVFDSPFVSRAAELADFARPSFTAQRPLVEALQELCHRIHQEFQYLPRSTSIDTPLLQVLRNRKGVCQDFAHLMIGALRSMGLPARYVSGYLRSAPGNQGAEASHAWISAFVPGTGWLNFDPTNDVMPTDGHVILAWGRDYGDVTPVRGIAVGGGAHTVGVAVSVQPLENS
jgi:transglutaminase-like putative cysteine protease